MNAKEVCGPRKKSRSDETIPSASAAEAIHQNAETRRCIANVAANKITLLSSADEENSMTPMINRAAAAMSALAFTNPIIDFLACP